jgi:glutamate synthase (NADPH/NADH) small chain
MLRQSHAHEEGGDLRWSLMTKKFLGEEGTLEKIRCVEVDWKRSKQGAPLQPVELVGTEFELEADLVLLSLGFVGPVKNRLVDELGILLDSNGNIMTDNRNMTSVEGIFAAGDMARGQSLVVWAIADGRRAARGIMKYLLQGRGLSP